MQLSLPVRKQPRTMRRVRCMRPGARNGKSCGNTACHSRLRIPSVALCDVDVMLAAEGLVIWLSVWALVALVGAGKFREISFEVFHRVLRGFPAEGVAGGLRFASDGGQSLEHALAER